MELYYQKVIDEWLKYVWLVVALLSLLVGYYHERQAFAWYACFGMTILSTVLVVPDWPIYQKHAVVFRGIVMDDANKKE